MPCQGRKEVKVTRRQERGTELISRQNLVVFPFGLVAMLGKQFGQKEDIKKRREHTYHVISGPLEWCPVLGVSELGVLSEKKLVC
jgi:hypothetical protein